jgi:hypothetical protein
MKCYMIDHSDWHVYENMEHILQYLKKISYMHDKEYCFKHDDILS